MPTFQHDNSRRMRIKLFLGRHGNKLYSARKELNYIALICCGYVTKEIREEVIKVRLMSEQIRNKLLEALRIRWYPEQDLNLRP